jgi:protein-S-isoprenylcysteine O-methyltransferase Ste14
LGIRHVFQERTKGVKKAVSRIDGLEKTLLVMVITSGLLLPVLYLFTPLLAFADYRLPVIVQCLGTAIMATSLWLFWRSHADLGQNWSISLELREDHQLVTHGVYRSVRHPMYASIWLWDIAQAMLLQNWFAGWAALLGFAALYFLRTPREERLMCESFGEEYREYMRQTGRLLPLMKVKKGV